MTWLPLLLVASAAATVHQLEPTGEARLIFCSDWSSGASRGGGSSGSSKSWRGGPSHCTCKEGQTKVHSEGAQPAWGWSCTETVQAEADRCEFDAICSHCKAQSWWPVCGVDGQTYSSACRAECRCVAVASQGACDGWDSSRTSSSSASRPAASATGTSSPPPTPGVSARVDVTRADGTHMSYRSRSAASDQAAAAYLAEAPGATTKLQQMELLQEHAATVRGQQRTQLQSPPPPPPPAEAEVEDDAIPDHLSQWHDTSATATAAATAAAAGADDAEEPCDSEDEMCFEQHSHSNDVGKGTAGNDDTSPTNTKRSGGQSRPPSASYHQGAQGRATYSSAARDAVYAANLAGGGKDELGGGKDEL